MQVDDALSEKDTVLALTIGGSLEPLRTALRVATPKVVLLVVSKASAKNVSSDALLSDLVASPGMPNSDGSRVLVYVPPDDPDLAQEIIGAEIDKIAARLPRATIVADYTGGTKSMSAALLTAAIARGIQIQIVTGVRDNLVSVRSGAESIRVIDTNRVTAQRRLDEALGVAALGDYAASQVLLARISTDLNNGRVAESGTLAMRCRHAERWARCMALWDRFDHTEALRTLDQAGEQGARWAEALTDSGHHERLKALARGAKRPNWFLCADLIANGQRRLRQGRFDDAVARFYRLTEAAIQVRLLTAHGVDTARVHTAALPPHMRQGRKLLDDKGKEFQMLALDQAAKFLSHCDPKDPIATAYLELVRSPKLGWLTARNRSILAHGFRPVGADAANEAAQWVRSVLVPTVGADLPAAVQLPQEPQV